MPRGLRGGLHGGRLATLDPGGRCSTAMPPRGTNRDGSGFRETRARALSARPRRPADLEHVLNLTASRPCGRRGRAGGSGGRGGAGRSPTHQNACRDGERRGRAVWAVLAARPSAASRASARVLDERAPGRHGGGIARRAVPAPVFWPSWRRCCWAGFGCCLCSSRFYPVALDDGRVVRRAAIRSDWLRPSRFVARRIMRAVGPTTEIGFGAL